MDVQGLRLLNKAAEPLTLGPCTSPVVVATDDFLWDHIDTYAHTHIIWFLHFFHECLKP